MNTRQLAGRRRRLNTLVVFAVVNVVVALGSIRYNWAHGSVRAQTIAGLMNGDPGSTVVTVDLGGRQAAVLSGVPVIAGLPLPVAVAVAVVGVCVVGMIVRMWALPVIALLIGVPYGMSTLSLMATRLSANANGQWYQSTGVSRASASLIMAAGLCIGTAVQVFLVRRAEVRAVREQLTAAGKPLPPTVIDTISGMVTGRLAPLGRQSQQS